MPITIDLDEELERVITTIASAQGFPDVASFVQKLIEEKAQQLKDAESPEARFRPLAEQWRLETRHLSVTKKMAEHPAYQAIISMGKPAIPLILAEMQREPGHWFIALREIVKDDAPTIPTESKGRINAMTEIWLSWGRERGYLQ